MIIEAPLFLSFVAIAGFIIVKAVEWRQDVLYGPYLPNRRRSDRP
jgi:hypothetical protein